MWVAVIIINYTVLVNHTQINNKAKAFTRYVKYPSSDFRANFRARRIEYSLVVECRKSYINMEPELL